jgi:AraC-like DNA-binding protein
VRLRSAVYFYVSCSGSWVAEAPASADVAAAVMPGAERVIEYHVVTRGDCWAAIVGEPPVRLGCGDVIMLPQGDAHVISSAPGMRANPHLSMFHEMKLHERPFRVAYDGARQPNASPDSRDGWAASATDSSTTLVCGFIGCDLKPFNPLIETLPRLLHVPASEGGAVSRQFAELAVAESTHRRPGSDALLERMSEMMFVDAVRRHVDTLAEGSTGWLAGLGDRFVGRALALLHERPSAGWNIEDLSKQVGLSRSSLIERFIARIGQPPMQYLAQWRMQIASQLLRDTHSSVASIALDVGYDSEAAFARAFKRIVGAPPGAWRRSQGKASSGIGVSG